MDLSSSKKFRRSFNRPYEIDTGNNNKYGKKVSTSGHRVLPNGSVVVSCTPTPKTTSKISRRDKTL